MATNMIFKRRELKYLMDEQQKSAVMDAISEHMELDKYGHSSIRNIYLDTDNFLLARRSIEKPVYKEKLRFRCYGAPEPKGEVFVELKKKFDSVVYKRRLTMPLDKAMSWFTTNTEDHPCTQIGQEIDFFRKRYPGIGPAMLLSYEREAYSPIGEGDLRITIDSNIQARLDDLDLTSEPGGDNVLPEGYTLMEIKTMYGYPEWLNELLGSNRLFKSSFSKYGNAYKQMVLGRIPEDISCLPGMSPDRIIEQADNGSQVGIEDYEKICEHIGRRSYKPIIQTI